MLARYGHPQTVISQIADLVRKDLEGIKRFLLVSDINTNIKRINNFIPVTNQVRSAVDISIERIFVVRLASSR